jgi:hypothetical protein
MEDEVYRAFTALERPYDRSIIARRIRCKIDKQDSERQSSRRHTNHALFEGFIADEAYRASIPANDRTTTAGDDVKKQKSVTGIVQKRTVATRVTDCPKKRYLAIVCVRLCKYCRLAKTFEGR